MSTSSGSAESIESHAHGSFTRRGGVEPKGTERGPDRKRMAISSGSANRDPRGGGAAPRSAVDPRPLRDPGAERPALLLGHAGQVSEWHGAGDDRARQDARRQRADARRILEHDPARRLRER